MNLRPLGYEQAERRLSTLSVSPDIAPDLSRSHGRVSLSLTLFGAVLPRLGHDHGHVTRPPAPRETRLVQAHQSRRGQAMIPSRIPPPLPLFQRLPGTAGYAGDRYSRLCGGRAGLKIAAVSEGMGSHRCAHRGARAPHWCSGSYRSAVGHGLAHLLWQRQGERRLQLATGGTGR